MARVYKQPQVQVIEAAAKIESLYKELAGEGVVVRLPDEVRGYLGQYPDILPVVEYAARITRAEFQDEAKLYLDVYHSREEDDRVLTLYVCVPSYTTEIIDRIERVQAAYAPLLERIDGFLLVTTDFRPVAPVA